MNTALRRCAPRGARARRAAWSAPTTCAPRRPTPAAYKEADGWKQRAAARRTSRKGNWWEALQRSRAERAHGAGDVSNQTLAQAEARYRQAARRHAGARAALCPVVDRRCRRRARAATRQQRNGALDATARTTSSSTRRWEPDLWGRVRRNVEAAGASAQASAADLERAAVACRRQLAQNYFLLRVLDAQHAAARTTRSRAFERSLQLTQNRYDGGRRRARRRRAGGDAARRPRRRRRSTRGVSARSSSTRSRCWSASRRRSFRIARATALAALPRHSARRALRAARAPARHRRRRAPRRRGQRADRRRAGGVLPVDLAVGHRRLAELGARRACCRCRAASGRSARRSRRRSSTRACAARRRSRRSRATTRPSRPIARPCSPASRKSRTTSRRCASSSRKRPCRRKRSRPRASRSTIALNQYRAGTANYIAVVVLQANAPQATSATRSASPRAASLPA